MLELYPVEPVLIAVLLSVTFLSALVQGTVGFGFSMLTVPTLTLVDPRLAPVPQIIVSVLLSSLVLARERKDADLAAASWVLLGQIPGACLGLLVLRMSSSVVIDLMIGIIVLFAVASIARGFAIPKNRATRFFAGAASTACALVSSIGGPPLALVFHGVPGPVFRGTLAMVFVVGSSLSVAFRGGAGEMLWADVSLALWSAPAVALGVWTSRFLTTRVEGRPLRIAVLALVVLAGGALTSRAIWTLASA